MLDVWLFKKILINAMANRIKKGQGIDTNAINKGNWSIGLDGAGMGPTATTGYNNGIQIPSGGYAIYSSDIDVRIAADDIELVYVLNKLGAGVQPEDVNAAIVWSKGNSVLVLNDVFSTIATAGLVLNVNAKDITSYVDNKPTINYLAAGLNNRNLVQGDTWNGFATAAVGISDLGTQIRSYNTIGSSYIYSHDNVLDDDRTTLSGQTVVFSMYIKSTTPASPGFTGRIRIYDNVTGYSYQTINVTTGFQRFEMTKTLGSNPERIFVMLDNTGGGAYEFHSPQLEIGTTATPFVEGERLQDTLWDSAGLPADASNMYTIYGLTYPESSQTPSSRDGITPGWNNITGNKLYNAGRDINYYVFDEDTNTWISDSFFNGERTSGHCYDTYDGQPNQHEQFNTDFDAIHAAFPNAAHIVIASHAAERFYTNTEMLQKLQSIGLPDGVAGNSRPEFILAGKVNKPWLTKFAYENVSSAVAHMNLSLPLESKLNIYNNPEFQYGKQFSLNESQGFTTSVMPTKSANATVVIWYKTTDSRELWVKGQSGSHYIAASNSGGNYYHEGSGAPTYYIDTVQSNNPTTSRNGLWHMFEAKNVNFSTWTEMNWFLYGSSWNINGQVAKIMIYDRVLSAEESSINYHNGPAVTDGLVSAYDAGNLVSYDGDNNATTSYSLTSPRYENASLYNIVSDKVNGGVWNFNGSTSYIQIPSTAGQISDSRTIEITFKMTAPFGTFTPLAINSITTSTSNRMWLGIQSNKFRMHGWGTVDPEATTPIVQDVWYTCVFSYDRPSQEMKVYTNGNLENTMINTQAGVSPTSSHAWYLGHDPMNWQNVSYSNVDIASFKVYDKILTQDEVLQNYNTQIARFK